MRFFSVLFLLILSSSVFTVGVGSYQCPTMKPGTVYNNQMYVDSNNKWTVYLYKQDPNSPAKMVSISSQQISTNFELSFLGSEEVSGIQNALCTGVVPDVGTFVFAYLPTGVNEHASPNPQGNSNWFCVSYNTSE